LFEKLFLLSDFSLAWEAFLFHSPTLLSTYSVTLCAIWWHQYSQKPFPGHGDLLCCNPFDFNKSYFALCLYCLLCFISPPFNSLLVGGKGPSVSIKTTPCIGIETFLVTCPILHI
jgi:hypothetical protein